MARFHTQNKKKLGLSPGSLVFTGVQKIEQVKMHVFDFNEHTLTERPAQSIAECFRYKHTPTTTWVNIDGLHDIHVMEQMIAQLGLSPMLFEDVLNVNHRPKVEEFDDCVFMTLKMLRLDDKHNKVVDEQVSLIVMDTMLFTFQEDEGDVFDAVRERLRNGRKRIRTSGPDYLAYALLDVVVDNYVFVVGLMGDKIEELESRMLGSDNPKYLEEINHYKREINYLRKNIRPAWEMIGQLAKLESDLIRDETAPFLRDLYDHVIQANEALDHYRDMLSDLLNIFHTQLSTKMNDIMKVLTIFSAIFIPLTFIAGIYGTNFDVLPELHYPYSYFIMWGVMIVLTGFMLYYFRRKKWL